MMLYLDTSALVKLYVDEPRSQELSAAVDKSEAVATSLFAYAEAMAEHTGHEQGEGLKRVRPLGGGQVPLGKPRQDRACSKPH